MFHSNLKMYNIKISDMEQPLLQVNLTEKDIKNGRTDLILLIPEFCAITGKHCSNYFFVFLFYSRFEKKVEA